MFYNKSTSSSTSSSYLGRDKRLEELKNIVVKILTPQKPAESQVVIASSVMQGRRPLGVNSPGGNTPLNKMIGNLKRMQPTLLNHSVRVTKLHPFHDKKV